MTISFDCDSSPPSTDARARVLRGFREMTGRAPSLLVRAPGRVNLIGEHTDYNDGFVLPMAIDRATWLALESSADDTVTLHSLDLAETCRFALSATVGTAHARRDGSERAPCGWLEYARGVAWALADSGLPVIGLRGALASDVPIGAGLSSSAAFELAMARAWVALADVPWQPVAMASAAQRAEREWVGVNCGIMDQLVCAAGRRDRALLIDCRSLDHELVPVPDGAAVVILDTGTRRGLLDSVYGERRAQCERAARIFQVAALRDVRPQELPGRQSDFDAVTYRRARHVVTENSRAVAAAAALNAGELAEFGALMNRSHDSLRDDYEVSAPALDAIVASARQHPDCYGARLTGAGFAGCAVALVRVERAAEFAAATLADYERALAGGLVAEVSSPASAYVCRPSDGATCIG